jgi:zinc protease
VVKPSPGSDLVSVQIWVKAGSRYEGAAENGVAHIIETAALTASANFPSKEENGGPSGAIESLGGSAGSLTSRDSTFYSALVASPYAGTAIKAMADAVLHPTLTNVTVEEAKVTVQDELARRGFDGVNAATDLAYATAYAKNPYRKPALGTLSTVASLNAGRAKAYHDRQYVGANISVVVVGDISAAAAQKLIATYFGKASAAKPKPVPVATEGPLKLNVVSRRARVAREALVLAWRSPSISNPRDVVAMDTLLSLWREGTDANLRKILMRDGQKGPNKPLVSSYDVDFLTQRDSGLFAISLTDADDKEAAVRAVLDEVKRVGEQGISPEELARAKEELHRQYIEQGESPAGQAGALGFYEMIDNYKFAVNYLDLCSKVTAEDVQRVAHKYLSPEVHVRADIDAIPLPNQSPDDNSPDVITAEAPSHRALVAYAFSR